MSTFLTPASVAERWNCSSGHVRRLCRSGALAAMRLGSDWRIAVAAVETYEQVGRQEQPKSEPTQEAVAAPVHVAVGELPRGYEPVFPELWT